jgi:hypothetical protein
MRIRITMPRSAKSAGIVRTVAKQKTSFRPARTSQCILDPNREKSFSFTTYDRGMIMHGLSVVDGIDFDGDDDLSDPDATVEDAVDCKAAGGVVLESTAATKYGEGNPCCSKCNLQSDCRTRAAMHHAVAMRRQLRSTKRSA